MHLVKSFLKIESVFIPQLHIICDNKVVAYFLNNEGFFKYVIMGAVRVGTRVGGKGTLMSWIYVCSSSWI